MAITFQGLVVRSERRIRLVFSEALAAGAFDPSWFTVACTDGTGADPGVSEVLGVAGAPGNAELCLSLDLADGGAYTVTVAAGVPAQAGSTTAADATHAFVAPSARPRTSASRAGSDVLDTFYQRDLVWDGDDFVEDATGDLDSIGGAENARAAGERAIESEGLPWNESYGAHLRRRIDEPGVSAAEVQATARATLLRDDRYSSVTASASSPNDDPGEIDVQVDAVLVGDVPISFSTQVSR